MLVYVESKKNNENNVFQLPWKLDGFRWFHFALDCNRQRDYKEYYPAQKCWRKCANYRKKWKEIAYMLSRIQCTKISPSHYVATVSTSMEIGLFWMVPFCFGLQPTKRLQRILPSAEMLEKVRQLQKKNGKKSLICYLEFSVLKSHQAIMWQLFQLAWKLDGSILLWIATDKEITKNITQRRNVRESAPITEKNGKKSLICYPEFSVLKSHQAIMWQLFQLAWKLDGSILLWIATDKEITFCFGLQPTKRLQRILPSAEMLEKVHQLQKKIERNRSYAIRNSVY